MYQQEAIVVLSGEWDELLKFAKVVDETLQDNPAYFSVSPQALVHRMTLPSSAISQKNSGQSTLQLSVLYHLHPSLFVAIPIPLSPCLPLVALFNAVMQPLLLTSPSLTSQTFWSIHPLHREEESTCLI